MKETYHSLLAEASRKSITPEGQLHLSLPLEQALLLAKASLEGLSADLGLTVMLGLLEDEVEHRTGSWGSQAAYRHGHEPGFVCWSGRKVRMRKPRLRSKSSQELPLERYQVFQQNSSMQAAVARLLIRHCSTRDYAGAIDQCLKGYGIKKSSVSRHWKAATQKELQKLLEAPLPSNLVALLLDGQHFKDQCVIVALGVDEHGIKHVLGLWHGATENSTVVKKLLEELIERGLPTDRTVLVVIDGAKALRRAVGDVLGDNALVQRCRIHKQRNVLDHLPEEVKGKAGWRLKAAWALSEPAQAYKELKSIARWLDDISPAAARSLEEGLEETLTLQRLGVNDELLKSFSSTNLIESCFSRTEHWTRRVKRWRDAKMILRWAGAALLVAQAGFRRVRGYRRLPKLIAAFETKKLASLAKAA